MTCRNLNLCFGLSLFFSLFAALFLSSSSFAISIGDSNNNYYATPGNTWYNTGSQIPANSWVRGQRIISGFSGNGNYYSGYAAFRGTTLGGAAGYFRGLSASSISCGISYPFWTQVSNVSFEVTNFQVAWNQTTGGDLQYSITFNFTGQSSSMLVASGNFMCSFNLSGDGLIFQVGGSHSSSVNNGYTSGSNYYPSELVVSFYRDSTDAINNVNNTLNQGFSGISTDISNFQNQAHQDSAAQLEESKKHTAALEATQDFVTDTSAPSADDIATSDSIPSVGLLPSGPLDSILLLPVNILNSIIQSFGGSCSPVVAPLPFVGDQNLTFPCFSDTFYTGSFAPLSTAVGGVASAFILYGYFKHLYKKVDRAISLETTDEDEWGIL